MPTEPYRGSIHIAASPEVVFEYFTRPEALVRWMGERATVDPRPGGEFTLFFGQEAVRGHYVAVDPPRSLVISWGRGGSAEFPPDSSTLEVTLTPRGEGTLVQIVHSGLPDVEQRKHAAGWDRFLPRLAAVAAEPFPMRSPPG